jgi:hypothetical protein
MLRGHRENLPRFLERRVGSEPQTFCLATLMQDTDSWMSENTLMGVLIARATSKRGALAVGKREPAYSCQDIHRIYLMDHKESIFYTEI